MSAELPLLERLAKLVYQQHRFIPGKGDDETLPEWEGLEPWKRKAWRDEVAAEFHTDPLRQPQLQGDRANIEVTIRRWGAAGLELDSAALNSSEDDVRWFVDLQLNTLGPADRCELTLTRRFQS